MYTMQQERGCEDDPYSWMVLTPDGDSIVSGLSESEADVLLFHLNK